MKLWQSKSAPHKGCREIEDFLAGDDAPLDEKLVQYDCLASAAHAEALEKAGVLSHAECGALKKGIAEIIALAKSGNFSISPSDEDMHTKIENHLTENLGALGKKIHTSRSRNDQVLAALRLYMKSELSGIKESAKKLASAFGEFAKENNGVPMPGYTHMQKAMPSSVSLWAGAFADSLDDDIKVLDCALEIIDQNPLGSGAGYGVPAPDIDRTLTAKTLGFKKVQQNPIYCANSRGKFEALSLCALSQIALTLNKFATDVMLFSAQEFGFFTVHESLCTGSSMMPQKRNPDAIEMLRAKTNLVNAQLFQALAVMQNLPSGYSRDLQLTKGPLISGIETMHECLAVAEIAVKTLGVNREALEKAMGPGLYAAERAHELAAKGVPFRDAYRRVKAYGIGEHTNV
ncbi:MAG: argininosuccinate lyase [Candidatus Diapherotrites archaeon]